MFFLGPEKQRDEKLEARRGQCQWRLRILTRCVCPVGTVNHQYRSGGAFKSKSRQAQTKRTVRCRRENRKIIIIDNPFFCSAAEYRNPAFAAPLLFASFSSSSFLENCRTMPCPALAGGLSSRFSLRITWAPRVSETKGYTSWPCIGRESSANVGDQSSTDLPKLEQTICNEKRPWRPGHAQGSARFLCSACPRDCGLAMQCRWINDNSQTQNGTTCLQDQSYPRRPPHARGEGLYNSTIFQEVQYF
jgi:hypothetical protein